MRGNSIFSNLTAETTVAEIKLLLSADYKKKRTVVLLEGEDDVKAFRYLVTSDVTLIKAYGASTTVDKFMPEYFPREARVIGIRDRDYQKQKRFERIFYCDYCCMEMMLVSDDETFGKVCENFYKGNLSPERLRREILSNLFTLSVIRKLSAQGGWGLKISDTDLAKIIKPGQTTRRKQTIDFVNSYNPKKRITAEREKRIAAHRDSGNIDEYMQITNGHDFLEVMRIYCVYDGSNNTRRSVTEKVLGAALRCAYNAYAFSKTALHGELSEYQTKHGLSIVRG